VEELIVFLREESPKDAMEILECIELLDQVVEDCANTIAHVALQALNHRDYRRVECLKKLHETIDQVQRRLDDYSELLQLSDTLEEIVAAREDNELAGILPGYDGLQLDPNTAHTLYESYTYTRPAGFELLGVRYEATDWRAVLLQTCEVLASKDASLFRSFLWDKSMKGRKVRYFVQNPKEVREPRKVNGTDIYVTTNLSANDIRKLIVRMLKKYDFDVMEYKVFLRTDYARRHS